MRRERIPHALPDGMSVEGLGLRATSPKSLSQRLLLARPSAGANLLSDLAPGTWAGLYVRGAFTGATTYEWDAAARRLAGRLVARTGRELTFEIKVDAELDWAPDDAKVLWWPSGIIVSAEIVAERTTARGRVTSGLVVRLGVRLTADGPAKKPECVAVRGRTGLLAVIIRARSR